VTNLSAAAALVSLDIRSGPTRSFQQTIKQPSNPATEVAEPVFCHPSVEFEGEKARTLSHSRGANFVRVMH
jgi:hypothetical protein